MTDRKPNGQFAPGVSGNPKGRPKVLSEVREYARQYSPEAVDTLVAIMKNEKAPAAARVSAAENVLSRAWGKAPQSIDQTIRDEREAPEPVDLNALLTQIDEERKAAQDENL